ncbi:hypothetical protein GALL_395050 [mine drainage metagenome]|uniref:Uncharacterized protein n=1 Tax=mine drainage metagenome TaxID=410659 RepID=A0A1J5QFM8_9ZZZZ
MAKSILRSANTADKQTSQYKLAPEARQSILAQSTFFKTSEKIAAQRAAFALKNGGFAFGQNQHI